MSEELKTYYLAGKGAAKGAFDYYVKPSIKDNPAVIGAVAVALVVGGALKHVISHSKPE